VTGYVAATGMSYVCPDTTKDALYLEGASGSRSSLTVPLIFHGTVIGTLNVESPQPDAFDDRDRQFIEIYGRNIAAALNTLELLEAEKVSTASASVEAINRELAIPLDDIITDATTVLDRYAGHDEDIIARLRHLLYRAREIRSLIHKAGDELADLTPEELAQMGVEERTDLLKYNIARHMKDLLGLDFIEIRLLDRATKRLVPLLSEGMTPLAANRELYARKEGNGVTGFVAASGMSYVCPDTTRDPPGRGAR
jgi:GAF domain-containing protein